MEAHARYGLLKNGQGTERLFCSGPILHFKGAYMWIKLRPCPSAHRGGIRGWHLLSLSLGPSGPMGASLGYSSIANKWELGIQKGWGL